MTQTSPTKPENKIDNKASLGAAAAAAASSPKPENKPAEAKPADKVEAKPDDKTTGTTEDKDGDEDGDEAEGGKKKGSSRILIAVGQVHEFETIAKAEKFLNSPGAPTEYSVLRGKRIVTNKKVSLR